MTKDEEVEAIKAMIFLTTIPPEIVLTINDSNKDRNPDPIEIPVHWLILPIGMYLLNEKDVNGIGVFKAIYERTNNFHKSYEIANVKNMAKHFLKGYKNTKEDKEAMASIVALFAKSAIKFYREFDYDKFKKK